MVLVTTQAPPMQAAAEAVQRLLRMEYPMVLLVGVGPLIPVAVAVVLVVSAFRLDIEVETAGVLWHKVLENLELLRLSRLGLGSLDWL